MTAERRFNPLTGSWTLVSAGRIARPWQGRTEAGTVASDEHYVADCYLCPGNTRSSGTENPHYDGVFVFENDFPALGRDGHEDAGQGVGDGSPLFRRQPAHGLARVICYHPRHDLTFATMDLHALEGVVRLWVEQSIELAEAYPYFQIFENRGALMGSSNDHPHGQIWAADFVPSVVALEDSKQRAYHDTHGTSLLADYLVKEQERGERIVVVNEDWLAVVPYWAEWPYEVLLAPRHPTTHLTRLGAGQRSSLADALSALTIRFDNLFACPFPYSMGWHMAPSERVDDPAWTLHAHFYPPLLRSANVQKFRVGYELLAEGQRDLSPEEAATALARQPARHYLTPRES